MRRPLLQAIDHRRGPAAGAADRRGRPGRRRVRGVPARDPVRLLGHHPRAGHVPGRRAADRGDHLEPHPRRARRPQAPLPLPLGRAPRLRARGGDRRACARPRSPSALARQVAAAVEALRDLGLYKPPGRGRDHRLGRGPGHARPRRRSTSAPSTPRSGTVLKYREDQERVRAPRRSARLVRRGGGRAAGRDVSADDRSTPSGDGRCEARPRRRRSRVLRRAGLDVPVGDVTAFVEALGAVGDRRAARGLLGGPGHARAPPEDIAVYDRAFAAFWGGVGSTSGREPPPSERCTLDVDDGDDRADAGDGDRGDGDRRGRRSLRLQRRTRCCATRTSPTTRTRELAEARRLMADLRLAGALRRSRRHRSSGRAAGPPRPAAHGAPRAAHRRRARPPAFLEPGHPPRRVVLLCDVSGSMEPYARALLRFAHAAVVGPRTGRGVRARHPPHPAHPRARRTATPTPRWPAAADAVDGLVGRHPPRRRPAARSTTSGACGAWPGARSW